MIILDETVKVFEIIANPRKEKYASMALIESLLFAYKATIITNIIGLVVAVILGVNLVTAITSGLIGFVVIAALEIFIGAALFHLAGKYVFRKFKHGFDKTVSAAAYTYGALQWLTLFASLIGVVLMETTSFGWIYVIFGFAALLWGLMVAISALSHLQNTTQLYAFGSIVLIPLVILVLYLLLAGAPNPVSLNSTTSNSFTGNVT